MYVISIPMDDAVIAKFQVVLTVSAGFQGRLGVILPDTGGGAVYLRPPIFLRFYGDIAGHRL